MTPDTLHATGGAAGLGQAEPAVVHSVDAVVASPYRFIPQEPETLDAAQLSEGDVEGLVLKSLLYRGNCSGRAMSEQLRLPRQIVVDAMERLRAELLVSIKGAAGLEDFIFQLTEAGYDRGSRLAKQCTYAGVAPVCLEHYIAAVNKQSIALSSLSHDNLQRTFNDLRLTPSLLGQLGQALSDGRGLFLYGPPGNGKTSISEIVVSALGEYIWIPYTISIDGELVRLYDPRSHKAVDEAELVDLQYDRRWILVHRPTIAVGGELTMGQLDLQFNRQTGICEASVQMRANGGALVIDDFGRQRMPTSEILNRLIVPMESNYDYLNLASGRQVAVPFDAMLVFSTNLEPRELVDEAFLRRIPYKIEVEGPDEEEFVDLFMELAAQAGCAYSEEAFCHLIQRHYETAGRPLRYCHPRDLLRQVRNYCQFNARPMEITPETIDVAVKNYFAGL